MAILGLLDPKTVSLLWADPDRASEIADMHAMIFDKPWDVESMRNLLAHPGAMSLIAKVRMDDEREGSALKAGFVLAQLTADEAEILSIGVLDEYQGRGLGKIMMQGLLRAAKIAQAEKLFLEVAEDNRAARRLYNGFQFKKVGERQDYYSRSNGEKVDALVLSRTL